MTIREPKLLQITTADGLYLHGYYVPSKGKENALLHIHGFAGNFYENDFVHVLASELEYKKVAFLTVNTRGSEKVKDFVKYPKREDNFLRKSGCVGDRRHA